MSTRVARIEFNGQAKHAKRVEDAFRYEKCHLELLNPKHSVTAQTRRQMKRRRPKRISHPTPIGGTRDLADKRRASVTRTPRRTFPPHYLPADYTHSGGMPCDAGDLTSNLSEYDCLGCDRRLLSGSPGQAHECGTGQFARGCHNHFWSMLYLNG